MRPIAILRTAALAGSFALACGLAAAPCGAQTPVGSAFTYQGSLAQNGTPVTGNYEIEFKLFDSEIGGTQSGPTLTRPSVAVTTGVFSESLDFGAAPLWGPARWVELSVRLAGTTDPYVVFPRQRVNAAPFAVSLALPHAQLFTSDQPLMQLYNFGGGGGGVFATTGTNTVHGLVGRTASSGFNSAGVQGEATAASGNVIGVEGISTASNAGAGVVGRGNSTGGYFEGTDAASNGVMAYGTTYGIYAQNTGTSNAAYFTGQGQGAGAATLRVHNTESVHGMATYMQINSDYATGHFQNDGPGEILWLSSPDDAGPFIVAVGGGGDLKFRVDNTGKTITKALQILGGADLSERFDVDPAERAIEPGMVVSVDPSGDGGLRLSDAPYDHRVAGVLSGAGGIEPGMVMGQEGSIADGEHTVALTGRVYCWVDASDGPVEPGDLLTTSSTPGHAMKVRDRERANGAILGKAMGRLERGRGLVLVLVGLQ
jgi:hypothetical protein